MKVILRILKKHWITVWLVLILMLLGAFISYAVYTEVSTVKRVVTTISAPKEYFSSNCMFADLYEKRMPSREYSVEVRNFDQNAPDVPNPSDVDYTLTAQLRVKYQGVIMTFSELNTALAGDTVAYNDIVARATGYSIGKIQDNNTSGSIASPALTEFSLVNGFEVVFGSSSSYETLPGGVVSIDRFKVTVPQTDFEKTDPEFYVYVMADPTDSGLTDIQTLLYGSQNVLITASWSGTLAERNTSTTDYDFYNYIITGSGSGKLDIMWDPQWFDINEFFFNSLLSGVTFDGENSTPTDITGGTYNGWKKVTIVVNSTTGESRYELQLYKKKSDTPYTGDNDAVKHIHCEMQ